MTKPYQLIVFDWEGTLGEDSLSIVLSVLSDVAQRVGLGPIDLISARSWIKLGLVHAVHKLFPDASMHQQEALMHEVQKEISMPLMRVKLMPGAFEAVRWIHDAGIHLAIATNKGHQGLMRALQLSGLDVYFQVTRSASHVPAKPCPQMLEEIMNTFAVTPSQTLMVGDSIDDMIMAASLGVDAMGVDFFHTNEQELRASGALSVLDDYQQLLDYLAD